MAEELKHLIKKIQAEGVAAGEKKAEAIEAAAKRQAEETLKEAKAEATRIIADATKEVRKIETSGEAALKQSGRDLIISLRKEIDKILNVLIKTHVADALSAKNLTGIIGTLVKGHSAKAHAKADAKINVSDISVFLNKKDLDILMKSFAAQMQTALKKGLRLERSDNIRAGFSISYDAGESRFDFTDESLAEYLGEYLRPRLAELLKETAKKK